MISVSFDHAIINMSGVQREANAAAEVQREAVAGVDRVLQREVQPVRAPAAVLCSLSLSLCHPAHINDHMFATD